MDNDTAKVAVWQRLGPGVQKEIRSTPKCEITQYGPTWVRFKTTRNQRQLAGLLNRICKMVLRNYRVGKHWEQTQEVHFFAIGIKWKLATRYDMEIKEYTVEINRIKNE